MIKYHIYLRTVDYLIFKNKKEMAFTPSLFYIGRYIGIIQRETNENFLN